MKRLNLAVWLITALSVIVFYQPAIAHESYGTYEIMEETAEVEWVETEVLIPETMTELYIDWDRTLTSDEVNFLSTVPRRSDDSGQDVRELIETCFRTNDPAAHPPYDGLKYGQRDASGVIYNYAYYCRQLQSAAARHRVPARCVRIKVPVYKILGERGSEGPRGPEGPVGARGPSGPVGSEGPPGPEGREGPQGPTGPEGPTGPQGERGERGYQGIPGEPGKQGPPGPPAEINWHQVELVSEAVANRVITERVNPTLLEHERELKGHEGRIGKLEGADDDDEEEGKKKKKGGKVNYVKVGLTALVVTALYDAVFDKNDRGSRGKPGPQGQPGAQGPKGDQGIPGDQGQPGPKGDDGAPGAQGPKGDQGDQGIPGEDGQDGASGPPGPPGPPGQDGGPSPEPNPDDAGSVIPDMPAPGDQPVGNGLGGTVPTGP